MELILETAKNVSTDALKDGTRAVLGELVGSDEVPHVTVARLDRGQKQDIDGPLWLAGDMGVLLLGVVGIDAAVAVGCVDHGAGYLLSFSASATREPAEYVLALAAAIFVARSQEITIEDGFGFWTGDKMHDPNRLLITLRLTSPEHRFEEACRRIVGVRLDPGG